MIRRDSAQSWIVVLVLGLATSIAFIDRVLLSVATPQIMKELAINGAVAGLLLSAFFWSYTAMMIPSGWLIDRFGTKRVLAIGYALWSIASAATGWATSLSGLVACRLGLGIGESPAYPTGYRLVATVFSERHRGLASAIYSEGAKIGPAVGAPLAAWLILQFGWRAMFVIVGLFSLIWLVPWLMVAPSRKDDIGTTGGAYSRSDWGRLLHKREIWGIILGYFGYLYVFYVYITWLPGYLVLNRGFTLMKAGWYAALPFIVQFVFGLVGGWLADYFIHRGYSATLVRKTAIAIGLLLGLAIVPAAFAASAETAIVFFTISLAGMGIAVPNMLAVPAALAPEGRGAVTGAIQNTAGNLGGVVAPMITGALYGASHSFTIALVASGAMLVVSGLGYLILIARLEPIRLEARERTALAIPSLNRRGSSVQQRNQR